jgi:hypothetical protein
LSTASRHRLWVPIVAIAAFIGAITVAALLTHDNRPPRPSALKLKYESVKDGMTRDEVEQLLGANNGEWLSKKDSTAADRELHWGAEDGVAAVTFEDGKVCFKRWDEREAPTSTFKRWLDILLIRE